MNEHTTLSEAPDEALQKLKKEARETFGREAENGISNRLMYSVFSAGGVAAATAALSYVGRKIGFLRHPLSTGEIITLGTGVGMTAYFAKRDSQHSAIYAKAAFQAEDILSERAEAVTQPAKEEPNHDHSKHTVSESEHDGMLANEKAKDKDDASLAV